jgi:hypothetical protein
VKELLSEVTLRLGCLEERVRASIGEPWLRKVSIVRWHRQLLDATDLRVDEPAQLGGAVALSGGDAATHQRKGNGQKRAEGTAAGRSFVLHVRVPPKVV